MIVEFKTSDGETIAEIEVSDDMFERWEEAADYEGMEVEDWILQAVREGVRASQEEQGIITDEDDDDWLE